MTLVMLLNQKKWLLQNIKGFNLLATIIINDEFGKECDKIKINYDNIMGNLLIKNNYIEINNVEYIIKKIKTIFECEKIIDIFIEVHPNCEVKL